MLAKKKGSESNPMDMKYAPIKVLKALGSLQRAALTPEAIPRSSSSTSPIISDWDSGLAMFIRKARTQ